jgi:hypothetical protein
VTNVITVVPHTSTFKHRGLNVVLRYDHTTKRVAWSFDRIQTLSFKGEEQDLIKARTAAIKAVDELLGDPS